jgi:hypothetical protein
MVRLQLITGRNNFPAASYTTTRGTARMFELGAIRWSG